MRRAFVAGVLVAGVALLFAGLFAQFGAGASAPGSPVFPQGIDGGGTQVGGRAVFLPGIETMQRTHIARTRRWLPGVGTGECEWTPTDVRMHAVRADGSIVPRRVIVSWRSPSGPTRVEAIVRHAPGRAAVVSAHPAWLWGPGGAAVLATGAWLLASALRVRGPNRCVSCGYDLRGLREGAPCPECGAAA